jgi:hypothetical protein
MYYQFSYMLSHDKKKKKKPRVGELVSQKFAQTRPVEWVIPYPCEEPEEPQIRFITGDEREVHLHFRARAVARRYMEHLAKNVSYHSQKDRALTRVQTKATAGNG